MAIDLALRLNTEILSADSRQCYREMNIGVAKPSKEELAKVKHHFIDTHHIADEVSAGMYEKYALDTLEHIFAQHDAAVCVGGTGLYIKALCEGIDEMPPVDPLMKAEVEKMYETQGLLSLQQALQLEDAKFFSTAEQDNPMRLMRALSFVRSHGRSILDYRNQQTKPRDFQIRKFVIDMDRDILYHRINLRVDRMMQQGLLEEVKSLMPYRAYKSLNTVGYSELFHYLDGEWTLPYAVDKIKQHTRNYAKRQITWFKHQGDFQAVKFLKDIIS